MKQIQMTTNSSFSLISTNKIIQMSDVSTSYDSKNFALEELIYPLIGGLIIQL